MSIRTLLNRTHLLLLSVFLLSACQNKKTGYVDIFKLVSEFELQKEYTQQAKVEVDREKAMIDSVVFAEKLRNPAANENLKNELYTRLFRKTEQRNKEIETMIWKRLNPYMADFGKENGYLYIYGANGTGNVLYADKSVDITDDMIKYVNNRYHDKK